MLSEYPHVLVGNSGGIWSGMIFSILNLLSITTDPLRSHVGSGGSHRFFTRFFNRS